MNKIGFVVALLDETNEILKKILNYLEKSNVSELIYHVRRWTKDNCFIEI